MPLGVIIVALIVACLSWLALREPGRDRNYP